MQISSTRWELGAWVLMTVVGLFLVFFRISQHSIWSDEAVSMVMADHGYLDILGFGKGDSHPPLYHLASKAFTDIFGHDRGVFRSFSALGLLAAALLLGVGPVSRVFNRRVGLIYAFLMLFASMNLTIAQEMRMYSWAAFLMTANAAMGYLYVRDGRRKDLLLFGLSSLAGVYIHYYVTLGVFFVHLYLLLWLLAHRRERLQSFLVEAGAVALCFSPWLFTLATQVSRNIDHFWISSPTIDTLLQVLTIPFALKTGAMSHVFILTGGCFCLLGYGIHSSRKDKEAPTFLLFGVATFVSVFLFVLVFSLTLRPILVPRYMLPLWGVLFMGVAWGIDRLFVWQSKWGWILGSGVLAMYFLTAIPSLNLLYFYQLNGPMDDVRQFGRENFRRDQVFLHFDETTLPPFVIEFPDNLHLVYRSPASIFYDTFDYFDDKVRVVTELGQITARHKQVWLVTSPDTQNRQAVEEAARFLGVALDNYWVWEEAGAPTGWLGERPGTIRFATPFSDFVVDVALAGAMER